VTPFPWSDVAVIAALILLNGVFSMSELAIVSARKARLSLEAERGSKAAKVAIQLESDPGKFLSTVQIGITLVGIIAGAYGGATLGGPTSERLVALGLSADAAEEAGFVLVIGITTYLNIVVGELVPKQIALRAAEPIALVMALPMLFISRIAAPFVWLLDRSSALLMRLLRIRHRGEHGLTAQELQMIFAEATRSGVIEEEERAILSGVMKLANRSVRELMTPRTEIDWIDRSASFDDLREAIAETPHSVLLVCEGSVEKVVGVVKLRDVLALQIEGQPVEIETLVRKAEVIPDQLDAMDALRMLQQSDVAMAMVHDEYGHLEGIVTPADLLEAIAGSFASHLDEGEDPSVVERPDGSLLVSGATPIDPFAERLGLDLPDSREFATVAGYVLWVLEKLPEVGETFDEQGWRFEIVDMDGRRIDKLLVSSLKRKKKREAEEAEPE
jgi:putative hemolysin